MRYPIALLLLLFIGFSAFSTYQGPKMGSFTDARDGQKYKTVEIGDQTWMAENLKFKDVKKSVLANSNQGRFYDWSTVMGLKKKYNKNRFSTTAAGIHQGICPKGWRIPNLNDWNKLTYSLDKKQPGAHLKSTSGWENDNNGSNRSGFNAKASGFYPKKSELGIVKEGYATAFWMTAETDKTTAQYFYIGSDNNKSKFIKEGSKSTSYACRCIQE